MGFRLVILADLTLGIGAGGIEVAQRRKPQSVAGGIPMQRPLDRQLGLAIGVERRLGGGLADRQPVRDAVDRAGRREDDRPDPGLAHRRQQCESAADVVAIIDLGLRHRLADIGKCRKMHHRADLMLAQRGDEALAIVQIAL